ncbi:hypothetical protein MPH_06792 [Macrophomina phaseolina MS6]|uniref:Uncharacterized protein n=1 Tax=Macrophomina phaseolina (strain MS6) TaxID=1126212 RepID=K2R184_MACPH|nr:hypothetical protein MPH_06792 [Macrophomina phaseolina MS6]
MFAPSRLVTAILLGLATSHEFFAQASSICYYPNGYVADKDQSCDLSSADAPCCPEGWHCLDGGICYLEQFDYISRYTCTDRHWGSDACPKYCLSGDSVPTETAAPTTSPTSVVPTSTFDSEPSTTDNVPAPAYPTADPTSIQATSSSPPSVQTSVISNTNGGSLSTVYVTLTGAATSTIASSANNNFSSSSKGVILGCAVGIPLSAVFFGLLVFLLLRRHRRRSNCERNDNCNSLFPSFSPEHGKTPRVSELDGFPRAAGGSIAPPSHQSGSHISRCYGSPKSGGAGDHTSTGAYGHVHAPSEADSTPVMMSAGEKLAPAEFGSPPCPGNVRFPAELEATEVGSSGGAVRDPAAAAAAAMGQRGYSTESPGDGSPDLGRIYGVGTVGGGLRIVNAVEGELDSEVEDGRDGGEGRVGGEAQPTGQRGAMNVEGGSGGGPSPQPPPPVYQSPKTWIQQEQQGATPPAEQLAPGGYGAAPDGIGSPVSPLWEPGWRK